MAPLVWALMAPRAVNCGEVASSRLEFAEGYCYWTPGGAHGWGEAAEEAH